MEQHIVQKRNGATVTYGAGGAVLKLGLLPKTTDARKIAIRWTYQGQQVTMHFGDPSIAKRVRDKFATGEYRIGSGLRFVYEPFQPRELPGLWTVVSTVVPWDTRIEDFKKAITNSQDQPRHIILYDPSEDNTAAVAGIRRLLGPGRYTTEALSRPYLKSFTVFATLLSEQEARDTVRRLHLQRPYFLFGATMTVEHTHARTFEIPSNVYQSVKEKLIPMVSNRKNRDWYHHLKIDVNGTCKLILEDQDNEHLRKVAREVEKLLQGRIMDGIIDRFWSTDLIKPGNPAIADLQNKHKVVIVVDHGRRELRFLGPESLMGLMSKMIRNLANQSSMTNPHQLAPASENKCEVCYNPSGSSVVLHCRHLYCKNGCFDSLCNPAREHNVGSSIRCKGCLTPVPIAILQENMSAASFNSLLEASLDAFIWQNSHRFWKCPTSDCGYLYRPSIIPGPSATQTCPGCFVAHCTYCRTQHYPVSCEQIQAARQMAGWQHAMLFNGGTLYNA